MLGKEELVKEQRNFVLELLALLGSIDGRTKLQKIVFLGQMELELPKLFTFDKYHYGPYSWELTETIEDLISMGYIDEETEQNGDYITYTYKLSDKHSCKNKQIYIPENQKDTLKKLSKLSRSTIIDYVYRKYLPERVNT